MMGKCRCPLFHSKYSLCPNLEVEQRSRGRIELALEALAPKGRGHRPEFPCEVNIAKKINESQVGGLPLPKLLAQLP